MRRFLLCLILPLTLVAGESMDEAARALVADLPGLVAESKLVLMGARKPGSSSVADCYAHADGAVQKVQDLMFKPIRDAGLGVRLTSMYIGNGERGKTPLADLAWHRSTLKPFLEREGAPVPALLARAASAAARAAQIAVGPAPAGLTAPSGRSLPEAALAAWLAGGAESAPAGRELAAATAHLHDLLRWQGALIANHLAQLAFMERGESVFTLMDQPYAGKYNPDSHLGRFPGGHLSFYFNQHYLEVERQAEDLFRPWPALPPAAEGAAAHLPPAVRVAFTTLRGRLGKANQATWDACAALPFERSYLAAQLGRAVVVNKVDALALVLARMDKAQPKASAADLMDVLMLRGDNFAGMEWGDRFQKPALDAIAVAKGGPADVLVQAHAFTNALYQKGKYTGLVLTLRDACATGNMDCIRSTDLMAAAYRNAGRGGFLNIRIARGNNGHTIGAVDAGTPAKPNIVIADALVKGGINTKGWPQWYFTGEKDAYSVELCGRGLNGYVLLEGYLIRGPNAGTLVRVPVPWLAGRERGGEAKVYKGPFPADPQVK